MVRAALMPLSDGQQFCATWIRNFFDKFGDHIPNSDTVRISLTSKTELHHLYTLHMQQISTEGYQIPVIQYTDFVNILNGAFPLCEFRSYCDIPGKCQTCYEIDQLRNSRKEAIAQEMLKTAHALHRGGLFMLERNAYKERVLYAIEKNAVRPSVLSIIIDGMDQNHCEMPYLGTQKQCSSAMKQTIVGVLEHGEGLTIYRGVETVQKGADLTIHCILLQLESWRKRNECYPDEIFVQVDGGSENANQYVLGMLELLVTKRMAKRIYYTRLPTGHTHEDIDACFGVIWKGLRSSPCLTLNAYKQAVERLFQRNDMNKSVKKATVIDLYFIPSYVTILNNCIDKNLQRLHKMHQTKHQWRFEAVNICSAFPFGCKTTFRAYSSNKVVEIIKKPKDQCHSEMGRVLGLEAVTVYCQWFPSPKTNTRRPGVEGFFLLRNLPDFNWYANIPLCPFPSDNIFEIHSAAVREARKIFFDDGNHPAYNEWVDWAKNYAVRSGETVVEYQNRLENSIQGCFKRIPFGTVLLLPNTVISREDTDNCRGMLEESMLQQYEPEFVWPELLAAEMDSVLSDFNLNPPLPRIFLVPATVQVLQTTMQSISAYYSDYLKTQKNMEQLKELLQRKISIDGSVPTVGGRTSKQRYITKIQEIDKEFFCDALLSSLLPSELNYIDQVLSVRPITNNFRSFTTQIVSYNNIVLQRDHFACFRTQCQISHEMMDAFCALLKQREVTIFDRHFERFGRNPTENNVYVAPKQSAYASTALVTELCTQIFNGGREIILLVGNNDSFRSIFLQNNIIPENADVYSHVAAYIRENINCMYLPYKLQRTDGQFIWITIRVELSTNEIHIIDVTNNAVDIVVQQPAVINIKTNLELFMTELKNFNAPQNNNNGEEPVLNNNNAPNANNNIHFYFNSPNLLFTPPETNSNETGIYAMIFLYMLQRHTPLILLQDQIPGIRKLLAHWIIYKTLPI